MEIHKALYRISQSGNLAAKKLEVGLKPYRYYKVPKTNGLRRHESHQISFTLVVDDFRVSYVNKADVEHLEASLKKHYPMTVDRTSNKYIGITFNWNYSKREMRSAMCGIRTKSI